MHRTSNTVKLLVGVAVTALSGCVSVQPQPSAPPRPGPTRPAQHLTPQIARPPVRDVLEAVPDPKPSPSPSAGRPAPAGPAAARQSEPRPPQQRNRAGATRAQPRHAAPAVPVPAPALRVPVTGRDVCALGRGYGRWPAGSPQSRICDEAYGR